MEAPVCGYNQATHEVPNPSGCYRRGVHTKPYHLHFTGTHCSNYKVFRASPTNTHAGKGGAEVRVVAGLGPD